MMDKIEAAAVVISAVNFGLLLVNYIAMPVRSLRATLHDLTVEIGQLKERLAAIEAKMGINRIMGRQVGGPEGKSTERGG